MIVTMSARYSALNYEDAVAQGTAIWRDFIGDPDKDLPWNATIRVELGQNVIESVDGTAVSHVPEGEAVLNVKVDIEQE